MRSLERLISLLMTLAILTACFTSCNDKTDGQGGKEEFQTDKYVASIEVKFATNDDKMKDAVYALNSSKSTLSVDGDKVKLDSLTETESISLNDNYVYIDGVIYHATSISANGKSASSYEKANMNIENRDKLISDLGTGADIGVGDFSVYEMTGTSGNYTYTCSDITDEAKISLGNIFASNFAGLNATVELDSAEYTLVIENDRDESYVLSCHFEVTMGGATYTITMHIYCDYDYDAEVNILAPESTDKYTSVSYEEIIK